MDNWTEIVYHKGFNTWYLIIIYLPFVKCKIIFKIYKSDSLIFTNDLKLLFNDEYINDSISKYLYFILKESMELHMQIVDVLSYWVRPFIYHNFHSRYIGY